MDSSDQTLRIEPLREFGATITGLDLAAPLSDSALVQVRDAFDTHSLLLFPGQSLSSAEQVRFMTRTTVIDAGYDPEMDRWVD